MPHQSLMRTFAQHAQQCVGDKHDMHNADIFNAQTESMCNVFARLVEAERELTASRRESLAAQRALASTMKEFREGLLKCGMYEHEIKGMEHFERKKSKTNSHATDGKGYKELAAQEKMVAESAVHAFKVDMEESNVWGDADLVGETDKKVNKNADEQDKKVEVERGMSSVPAMRGKKAENADHVTSHLLRLRPASNK